MSSLFMRLHKQQYFSIIHTPQTYHASKYLSFSSYTSQFFLSTVVLLLLLPEHSTLVHLNNYPSICFLFTGDLFEDTSSPYLWILSSCVLEPISTRQVISTNPLVFNKDFSDLHTTQSSFNWHYLVNHSFLKHSLTWLFCLTFFFHHSGHSGHSSRVVSSLPLRSLCVMP